MKDVKFYELFLLFSWINFFATKQSLTGSVILLLAGAYALSVIVPEARKVIRE